MANLNFDKSSDDAQVSGRNATNNIAMYLFSVSSRRASRHVGRWKYVVKANVQDGS